MSVSFKDLGALAYRGKSGSGDDHELFFVNQSLEHACETTTHIRVTPDTVVTKTDHYRLAVKNLSGGGVCPGSVVPPADLCLPR